MKWVVRFLAVVGLYYGGLMLAGSLGIGHSFFYYGRQPVQVYIDKDDNKAFVVEIPSHAVVDPDSPKETPKASVLPWIH